MNRFLKVKLFDKLKTDDGKQEVIVNPLAISSITLCGEKDVIKMQNGDEFVVDHGDYVTTSKLVNALTIEIKTNKQ